MHTCNVHLQENNDIAPLFIQLTKCTLNSSWTNFILLAYLPYAKAVAKQATVYSSNLLLTPGKCHTYSFGIPLEKVIDSGFCFSITESV